MNSISSGRMTAWAPGPWAISIGIGSYEMSRSSARRRALSGLASKASHSAAKRCWICRYGRPPCQKMKPLGSRKDPASRSTAPASGAGAGGGTGRSATLGAVIHGDGALVRVAAATDDAGDPGDLVPEEERHRDGGGDDRLDDEATRSRIDVGEFGHVARLR